MSPAEPVVVVTRRWPSGVERELRRRFPAVRLSVDDAPLGPDGLRQALEHADAVLPTVSDRLPAELFDGGIRARFLGNFGVGVEHIDTAAAGRAGVVVTNTPGVLTDATADTAVMLMLMAARRAGEGERELRAGAWTGWRPTHLMGTGVSGKTLGVLGIGRIGTAVARRAHFGFSMPVAYHDPSPPGEGSDTPASRTGIPALRACSTVEELLATSDVVSLHLPGGGANTHLIDAGRLAQMRPTAFLVNTARGDVVDTAALVAALRSGTIAGAGLDVYEGEPEVPAELRRLENVVLLPHLGSATEETRTAMGMTVIENLEAFLDGRPVPCPVA